MIYASHSILPNMTRFCFFFSVLFDALLNIYDEVSTERIIDIPI
jgi:hypothetical protein